MSSKDQRELIIPPSSRTPVLTPGGLPNIDLSSLPEAQQHALMEDYVRGMIDVKKKAEGLQVDVRVLKDSLDALAGTTREVSEAGNAITATISRDSELGRYEIKMGNTEEAKSGKLSRSQSGERDWTPIYIFAGIGAVVLIAFLFAGGG